MKTFENLIELTGDQFQILSREARLRDIRVPIRPKSLTINTMQTINNRIIIGN